MSSTFRGGIGLQLVLSLSKHYSTPEIVGLAGYAREVGFDQVWVDDHAGSRNLIVVLSAIAVKTPMKLGTAIMVPYYRHPAVAATALASISELIHPHELSVGLARGGMFAPTEPITMLEETAKFYKEVLAGRAVRFGDFPLLTSYHQVNPEAIFQMDFTPQSPIHLYCGGNAPRSIEVGGRFMDGLLFGGHFILLLRTGKLQGLLDIAEKAAREGDPGKRLRKVAEINISLSSDVRAARDFPKPYIATQLRHGGDYSTSQLFLDLGIDHSDVKQVTEAWAQGATREKAATLVTQPMVDAMYFAGDLSTCKDQILEACRAAADYGFDQVSLTKLGPDCKEAIQLLSKDILPILKSW